MENTELKVINIEDVRCYEENGVVMLNLEDVARGLGFVDNSKGTNKIIWNRVNKYLSEITATEVSLSKDNFITENIFYRLCMKAKNEVAEKFQSKVCDEILPTIRKHGAYMTDEILEKALTSPEFLIQLATKLKEEKEKVKNLTTENKALIKQTFTWDFSSTVNALMRKYASSKGITFSKSWGCLYKEVKYKYGYDVKNRGGSGSMLSKFTEGEFADVIATASAMCSDLGIDVGKVTNEVNKENINT